MTATDRELFGTDEPAPERRLLRAGPLSAILEEGNLRDIRWHGVEAVRAVNYLARDRSWGTYKPRFGGLDVTEGPEAFTVAYEGLCSGPEGSFRYRMSISGEASGTLVMEARGEALTDFPTNRTGFVVLHPAEAAGGRLSVRRTNGETEPTAFPGAISPDQPVLDIAALTHEPAPGLSCRAEMEGDAFEMEDQRNWSDASFKTYVRPLSKPWPYTLPKGSHDVQRVTISLGGEPAQARPEAGAGPATLRFGDARGRMPELALFLDPEAALPSDIEPLRGSAHHLVARLDLSSDASPPPHPALSPRGEGAGRKGSALPLPSGRGQGEGASLPAAESLRQAAAFARSCGLGLVLEGIFAMRDPDGEAQAFEAVVKEAGVTPAALLVSPRREFRTRPSNHQPEGEHGTATLVAALRRALPGMAVGAGTPSFFTEFNRNPPEPGADFAFFGMSATVHAADDVSVVETTSVVPALIESARRLGPGVPLWFGPALIGMRHNPYGSAPAENPAGGRVPMARFDPRHGALFGAAWALAVAAHAAAGNVEMLTLAAPAGPFGLLHDDGRSRPILALHGELAAAAGAARVQAGSDAPGLALLAWRNGASLRALAANLASGPITVEKPDGVGSIAVLGADGQWGGASPLRGAFTIRPYRTVLLS